MKKILLIILTLFCAKLYAQQMTEYSMHFLNKYAVNPAAAGSESFMPVMFSYKQYWTGIDEAPRLQQISTHSIIGRRVGLGCKIINYQTGPLDKTGAELTYAYHIPLNANGAKLSLGLSGLIYQYSIDLNKLTFENPREPLLTRISEKMIVPDFSIGAYFYTKQAYIGAAFYQLLNRKIDMMVTNLNQRQVTHLMFNGGYNFILSNTIGLEPMALFKFMSGNIFQADAGFKFKYQYFWIGASFRTDDAIVSFVGFSKDNITIGYSYDYVISNLSSYTNGSHEIFLAFKINTQKPKIAD
ncbi:MAG: type IX secretion system membrane protein PorP/SprF [Bacteroidia bacterium]|nr:type IX secretion system membrane protein PorP/SprF [Bacteroidia bacterium]